jgi:phosphoribosyl 1,2-cyclic phosphate phosphodiesterase
VDLIPVDQGVQLGGWNIRGWRVNHGKNGHAYAYRLEKDRFSWAYCSDSIGLNEAEILPLHNLDLLVLGTSFYYEDAEYATRSVYDMLEAQELIARLKPNRTVFTHMSHDVDITRSYGLLEGISLAQTGMSLSLK